ncbi:type 1 glutamine amidotransferase domain-containing protein [Rhizobium sp. SSA_523]|uniref:type 1 glutamine amidotransferase domain-containing protein n=1 Tax=Rhizobium sp. SSA_523 TaxID=2952477 RepID=UPI00209181E8|nr:type 1 glutamine amidotransferase domain-containing protein [Rhizobium sp. SSA_523]MCO5734297.1 type 1 glutamine amidotransferase [Rhizobium sp. SSA_523]WKC21041.1 type 1 glutamine amidotransferase domain-containing protein [Rhizobium sp. SSA_523]
MNNLANCRILILATDGFEDAELYSPRSALLDTGAQVTLASPRHEQIRGCIYNVETGNSDPSEETIMPDRLITDVEADQFDALVLPGGVVNPDKLRLDPKAIALVRDFVAAGKPVASICHGPWLLVEADVLRGRRATAWYSIRTDLKNAGATVVDEEVVVDGNIITSRMPSDIPAFNRAIVAALQK